MRFLTKKDHFLFIKTNLYCLGGYIFCKQKEQGVFRSKNTSSFKPLKTSY